MSAVTLGPCHLVSLSIPGQISRPETPGTTGTSTLGLSSAWYLLGRSKGSSCRVSATTWPPASCCCLCGCGGSVTRTILAATKDQVLCVSVCQSIWIFTSRAGDSFNFKSPANDVWSLKYQSESFHRTTPAVHSWHGAVLSPNNLSQYYVEIVHVELCHCQCNLAKYQYFWKL